MSKDHASEAIEEIHQLTKHRLSQDQLFIESIIYSNTRLKLAVLERNEKYDLVRLPSSYLYAHIGLFFAIVMVIAISLSGAAEQTRDSLGMIFTCVVFSAGGYGFIWYFNDRAKKANPLWTYDPASQRLCLKSTKRIIACDNLCCLIALSSIGAKANKPEKSNSELKLIYLVDGRPESFTLTKTTDSYLPRYDDEAKQIADILNIPYLHADRTFHTGQYMIERIV
ncbi:hypothetical protein OAF98_01340 [Planctomicrobium sp.]|nr:hypothetical protein [Planctomicrobium sp.]MDB4743104.1 hypothetical protein [Planctomicrobium sp.]